MSPACPWLFGDLNFTFCVMESWAVTAPSLVYTSFETVAKALSDTTREKELILLPLIFPFCSVFVLTRARTVFLGVTEGLLLCLLLLSVTSLDYGLLALKPACSIPCFVCWVWPKAPQACLNPRGQIYLPNPRAPFHWATPLECFFIYLCALRGRGPPRFAPLAFCRLPCHSASV